MRPITLVAPESLGPLEAYLERMGRAPAGPSARATRGEGPLPLAAAGRRFADLARVTGDAGAGLRIGAASRFEDSPLGRDVRGSPTVGAALAAAARTSERYCAGQRLRITEADDEVRLERRFAEALGEGRRQANDFALCLLIDLVRRGAGPDWRPDGLQLEGAPPAHAEELAALAARDVRFEAAADTLVFPRSILARPLPAPARPAPVGVPLPEFDFVESVRWTVRYLLDVGELSLSAVAEAAGTSTRSLQRRLAAAGLGFAQLVEEARFHAASRMLRDPAVRITDVSLELGYSDAANFTRAFRRWAGVSPLAYRRAHPGASARRDALCSHPPAEAPPGLPARDRRGPAGAT